MVHFLWKKSKAAKISLISQISTFWLFGFLFIRNLDKSAKSTIIFFQRPIFFYFRSKSTFIPDSTTRDLFWLIPPSILAWTSCHCNLKMERESFSRQTTKFIQGPSVFDKLFWMLTIHNKNVLLTNESLFLTSKNFVI